MLACARKESKIYGGERQFSTTGMEWHGRHGDAHCFRGFTNFLQSGGGAIFQPRAASRQANDHRQIHGATSRPADVFFRGGRE